MSLEPQTLSALLKGAPEESWRFLLERLLAIHSQPMTAAAAPGEVTHRDRLVGELDHLLAGCAWDLWQSFDTVVEKTATRLKRWWSNPFGGKAVLILDGLSLRELPWLLEGAKARGFTVEGVCATASELPSDTTRFAKAIGLNSRSQLENNAGGASHALQPARTESLNLPWTDCAQQIDAAPHWLFWHHWPDAQMHDEAGAGQGLDALTRDAARELSSDAFWAFVERLATGRRLVITSDHGYAATSLFPDAEGEIATFLKKAFSSGRFTDRSTNGGPFAPPVALPLHNAHGGHLLALGRRKWKSQGGYPTLAHGGMSLLEVLSPFLELSKTGG